MSPRPYIDPPTEPTTAAEYWDSMYAGREPSKNPTPNNLLVEEAAGLPAGRALDLGCGAGGDSIWLAKFGWDVTAAEVSAVAVDQARANAVEAGVETKIRWQLVDLASTFPAGSFDLVSAQFLQSPIDLPWQHVYRQAASAVAPAGHLVIGMHGSWPTWFADPPTTYEFATIEGILDAILEVDWTVLRAEPVTVPSTSPDGVVGERNDIVVHVQRR